MAEKKTRGGAVGSDLSRREFVRGGLLAGATLLGGAPLVFARSPNRALLEKDLGEIPTAPLGKTGVKVPILGLGTAPLGHQNGNRPDIKKLVPVFSEAIDRGITYVDTARIYGGAEEALGQVLKTRRDRVFLATKVWANDARKAQEVFEESLRTLQVDSVDLLHLHSCGNKDIDEVLGSGGSWEYLLKMKKEGKTRFLGITGHNYPARFVRMIRESKTVDVMMVAMNFVDYHIYGFERTVLPVAREHGVGVMAMKVYGGILGPGFRNYKSAKPFPSQMDAQFHESSIRYEKSLEGVTGMVIGVHGAEQVRKNIERVIAARPLGGDELEKLRETGKKYRDVWGARFGPAA